MDVLSNSIKEINRLGKEINKLLSKNMPKIYLKVTIEEKWRTQNLDFPSLKSFCTGKFLRCSNSGRYHWSEIRGLEAKLCVAFLIFLLERCTMCFSSYKNCELKVNLWWVEVRERKKTVFFVNDYVVRRNYFQHFCFISIYSVLNNLSEYI